MHRGAVGLKQLVPDIDRLAEVLGAAVAAEREAVAA